MEELFSVQALVHYYDKASVDHAAVKRLLSSAGIDNLQLLLSDGSTTTLQNYLLIPRPERPSISDVATFGGQSPATLAAVVMLAEARAAADSVASSSVELDIACSALERLLGSLSPTFTKYSSDSSDFSVDKTVLMDSIYQRTLAGRRHLSLFARCGSTTESRAYKETPSSILSAVNARLRLCDIATHCLAVVARQSIRSEVKCKDTVALSTRLLSLALALPQDATSAPSASFSSRNSLRTALISGAIHIGVIASENSDIDVEKWVQNANRLMIAQYSSSGSSQIIAAVFGGMLPVCSEYRDAASDKAALNVTIPLSILHEVLGEQLERTTLSDIKERREQSDSTASGSCSNEQISKAAQSFLGERVVAAEEDGDEGRIAGGSGYNACENYIKRAGEGEGVKDLLVSLLLAAGSHCAMYQSLLPSSSTGAAEEVDIMSDGCTSNSEGHPGSIDLFDHRFHSKAFSSRVSTSAATDAELDATRSLSYHRKVAVLCIEALGSWLLLSCQSLEGDKLDLLLELLEVICSNSAPLLENRSITSFDVRAALANFGSVCGAIVNNANSPSQLWREHVCNIVVKSRHCVVLLKQMLRYCESSERVRGVLTCYISEFLLAFSEDSELGTRRKSSEDYVLYMMSLITADNALDVLSVFAQHTSSPLTLPNDPSKTVLFQYAVTLQILDFLTKLAFGLNPSKSNVQIAIVRLCNLACDTGDSSVPEEITSEVEVLADDFANVKPSQNLKSLFVSVAPSLKDVLYGTTGAVLSPFWSASVCPTQERSSNRLSFIRGLPTSDIMEASESVLEAAAMLHQTLEYAVCVSLGVAEGSTSTRNLEKYGTAITFLDNVEREEGLPILLNSLLAQLQESIDSNDPLSVSLLYQLECCTMALTRMQDESLRENLLTNGSLVRLLDGCLKKFATVVPIGFPNMSIEAENNAGLFGINCIDELTDPNLSTSGRKFGDLTEEELYSPVRENIRLGTRYYELLRSNSTEDIIKGVLDRLVSLLTQNMTYSGEGGDSILLLADVVSLCWPQYKNIAASMYNVLSFCISSEIQAHESESNYDVKKVSSLLLRMSSWRFFIEEAPKCTKTLHGFCKFAESSITSGDFDLEALALALLGTTSSNLLPDYITTHVRPNTLYRIVPELLVCRETAAVAVQSHAQALQSLTAACTASSIWRIGVVKACQESVIKFGSAEKRTEFLRGIIESSVMESSTMSTAIFDFVDVLGEANSETSAFVLQSLFDASVELLVLHLLSAVNSSLYRIIELSVRLCCAHEQIDYSGEEGRCLFADFINIVSKCITAVNACFEDGDLPDSYRKLAVVLLGLLHICRKGHVVDASPKIPCTSTVSLPCTKNCSSIKSEDPDNKSPPKRSSKRLKQMEVTSRMEPKPKPKPKQKSKWSKKSSKDVELCTFTTTGDQFVEQHWYFCYSCGLTGSEGVCVVCARTCHAGCDIAYSRHSRFFCDCGASGAETKPVPSMPPPPSHPTGSSDSDVSMDRKDNGRREKRGPLKRRRCISLKPQDVETSVALPPPPKPDEEPSPSSDRFLFPTKSLTENDTVEMALLSFASPKIGRCVTSFKERERSGNSNVLFEEALSSTFTVGCVLELSQRLMACGSFFNTPAPDLPLKSIPMSWCSAESLSSSDISAPTLMPLVTSSEIPGKLVRVLKGGGFTYASKSCLDSKSPSSVLALSNSNEYLAIPEENSSISILKASSILSCKSSLDRSSLSRLGQLSVPFPVRKLSFHPRSDETLLVVGETSICVIIIATDPFMEKAVIHLELGLDMFDGSLGFEVGSFSSDNIVKDADWLSDRDCSVLVRTETFVKVFDVNKDNLSPAFFVPVPHGDRKANSENGNEVDIVVDVFPLAPNIESGILAQCSLVDFQLIAFTRRGQVLLTQTSDNGESSFLQVYNTCDSFDDKLVSIVSVSRRMDSNLFWVACSNGSVLKFHIGRRAANGKNEFCIGTPVILAEALQPGESCAVVPVLCSSNSIFAYKARSSVQNASIISITGCEGKKFDALEGPSSAICSVCCFFPSAVSGGPARPGCLILLDDGGFYRMDLAVGPLHVQFSQDPEAFEVSSLLSQIQNGKSLSKQTGRKRKVLVHEKFNPVPSTIGFFEKTRLVQETARATLLNGSEHETEIKIALGGGSSEVIISSVPFMIFQCTISVDLHGSNSVLVGARLKFGASDRSKHRVPRVVRVFGREVRWNSRNGMKRWLDVPFTVLESSRTGRQVVFEFETQKPVSGSSSSVVDGLVAIDCIQLYEVPQSEFADRKASFDNEAAVFRSSAKASRAKQKLQAGEGGLEMKLRSTVNLFKSFDSRYATALSAIDIASQSNQAPLDSVFKLALSIGVHCLQLVYRGSTEASSPLKLLEDSRRRLSQEVLKCHLGSKKIESSESVLSSLSRVCLGGLKDLVLVPEQEGDEFMTVNVELSIYCIRVISSLCLSICSNLPDRDAQNMWNSLVEHSLPDVVVKDVLRAHKSMSENKRRLCMSPRKTVENVVDLQLIRLVRSVRVEMDVQSSGNCARSVIELLFDSSQSTRLFAAIRVAHIFQDPSRLICSIGSVDENDDAGKRYTYCFDMNIVQPVHKKVDETSTSDSSQRWAYRCDNCGAVCKKEWWHCMDSEDFDLCEKCVRGDRSSISDLPTSHILVRGDPEHNLDELNLDSSKQPPSMVESSLTETGFTLILEELACAGKQRTNGLPRLSFSEAAHMLSTLIGPQTQYRLRIKYITELCSSNPFLSRIMRGIGSIVPIFDSLGVASARTVNPMLGTDWEFAYAFIQVFASVRDSISLPPLIRKGICSSFAYILKQLEPKFSDVLRRAAIHSQEQTVGNESHVEAFDSVWQQISNSSVLNDEAISPEIADFSCSSPSSSDLGNFCPVVSSILQLTSHVLDFLGFALQSACGPEVDQVISAVPKSLLCSIIASESRHPRLKGNTVILNLIVLSRRLLLAVSDKDETSMHRVIDSHIYQTHIDDLRDAISTLRESTSSASYSFQVEVFNSLKCLHRLVSKRPATWRDFCLKEPESLETILSTLDVSHSLSHGFVLQLAAVAFSTSVEMAAESIRSAPTSTRSRRLDGSGTKSKKHSNDSPEPGDNREFSGVRESDDVIRCYAQHEWALSCAKLCLEGAQVSVNCLSINNFAVLNKLISCYLMQTPKQTIRIAAARILCSTMGRAAVSSDIGFVRGFYGTLFKGLRNLVSAGALGTEFGHCLEVFVAFCNGGYFECLGSDRVNRIVSLMIDSLRSSSASLVSHPNAHVYKSLANVIDLQGYYLEAEPCTTCSIEAFESSVPVPQRLESIRVEAKYTDCQIMCRLASVQAISGVSVKVVDPRRTRRVKKIDVYYSPRIVSDSTELKSASHPWQYFASIVLSPTQLEGKVELSVPISTANLRYWFTEFHCAEETNGNDRKGSTTGSRGGGGPPGIENLQCPRCSRSVTDRYGICRNCHENAFQCRQCRNINYENLDGFLCNECGYCKHARFEFSVTCKSSFVAEKIFCEEDRKRAVAVIEKEVTEVHRKHEELKKMRSKVLKALTLGPKHLCDSESTKEEIQTKGPNGLTETPIRADIATLEALLGGQIPHDVGDGIPIAVDGSPAEMILGGSSASLDLSGRGVRDPRDHRRSSAHPFSFLAKQSNSNREDPVSSSTALNKQTSLVDLLYSRDCKSLFMSMSQSIRLLSATRKELIQYAASCLKRNTDDNTADHWQDSILTQGSSSEKMDMFPSSCYGCIQSFLANCIDFLYAIVRIGGGSIANVKTPDFGVELLRLSTLCEKKEVLSKVRRLVVHLVSGNQEASDVICREISRKIEFCIDSFATIDARSVARLELTLLEDIALIDDNDWEKRFRAVMRILFQASKTALSCASIAETVILPCLRIALQLLGIDDSSDPFQEPADYPLLADPETLTAEFPEESNRPSVLDIDAVDAASVSGDGNLASPMQQIQALIDGSESVASNELRQYRPESDQLSVSGAPSSIGTAFEEHPSDDESQSKTTNRTSADVTSVVVALREDHESGLSGIGVREWLAGRVNHDDWLSDMRNRSKLEKFRTEDVDSETIKKLLAFQHWRSITRPERARKIDHWSGSWAVRLTLLAPSSQVRETASILLQALISNEETLHLKLLDSLTGDALDKAISVSEGSREFFSLLRKLVRPKRSKLYLVARGFTKRLSKLIHNEACKLFELERSSNGVQSFSLTHGFVLSELVTILKLILDEVSKIRDTVRVKIFADEDCCVVTSLQQAYLSTRRLLSLRTRLTDESGKILCEILSSPNYLFFSKNAVKVVRSCVTLLRSAHARDDAHTVSVLLEQLCSMLCPETADPVCFLTLNKSPTQDEFIRGSMSKNPYSSSSFPGPLMRDVKNKICADLDLPALMEDDFGMELLVAGNLVKLDLPIMAVYEQVWRNSPHATMAAASPGMHRAYGSRGSSVSGMSSGSIHPLDMINPPRRRDTSSRSARNDEERVDVPMTVIYRLAGLDGEATENIIETLATEAEEDLDLEDFYKTTEMLGDVDGLDVLLALLSVVGSWGDDAETAVREPALKLLRACCEVSKNRSILATKAGTLSTLLDCAASAFEHSHNSPVAVESAESLLIASEKILAEKSIGGDVVDREVSVQANLDEVLSRMQVFLGRLSMVSSSKAEASILHLLPFLMQGIPGAVDAALSHFQFEWNIVDHNDRHLKVASQFATVLVAAPRDNRGQALILRTLEDNCAGKAVAYLCKEFPMPKSESKEVWDCSLEHGGPPTALKILKGLALGCSSGLVRNEEARTFMEQALLKNDHTISMLCQLEITASSSSVGSFAEELLEALLGDAVIAAQIESERLNVKETRRKAAEASRNAILRESGLSQPEHVSGGGPSNPWLDMDMFDDVVDEVGPSCVVCGDGFRSRPNEALGVYVLSRRVQIDCSIPDMLSAFTTPTTPLPTLSRPGSRRDSEPHLIGRSRSSTGGGSSSFCYSTVTQFNAIHLSCHRDAARSDRGSRREEWEGATLRNSHTICNNILPILPPVTCTPPSPDSTESFNSASSSMNIATEYYLTRLMSLGRSSLSPVKLSLCDLGRLMIRFSHGGTQVFSVHSRGGGPHSNACLIPHMVQLTLHLLNSASSPSSVSSAADPSQISEKILEMEKYLKEEEQGDVAYFLAVALVFVSAKEWRAYLPAFLRLALRDCGTPETALRVIAFSDVANVYLKHELSTPLESEALRQHIGKEETFSTEFADDIVGIWENNVKDMESKSEFLKLIDMLSLSVGSLPENVEKELSQALESVE